MLGTMGCRLVAPESSQTFWDFEAAARRSVTGAVGKPSWTRVAPASRDGTRWRLDVVLALMNIAIAATDARFTGRTG